MTVIDISAFDQNEPATEYGRALRHIGKGLVEFDSAVRLVHSLRTDIRQGDPLSQLQAEVLESILEGISSDFRELQGVIAEFDKTNRPDGPSVEPTD